MADLAELESQCEKLRLAQQEAIAAHEFRTVHNLELELKRKTEVLAGKKRLGELELELQHEQKQRNWLECERIYARISAIRLGHAGKYNQRRCDKDCEHGVHAIAASHWTCCGQIAEKGACGSIQVGDLVALRSDTGRVLFIEPEKNEKPYFIQTRAGATKWCSSAISWLGSVADFHHPHVGGFRVPLPSKPSSPVLFRPASEPITEFCDEFCTHKWQPRSGFRGLHWECCGQGAIDAPCVQRSQPILHKVGDVIGYKDAKGYIISVDAEDPFHCYQLALDSRDTIWVGLDDAQLQPHTDKPPALPSHLGEFRTSTFVLVSAKQRATRQHCSLESEPDGLLCAHAAKGDPVRVIPEPHYSCCGHGLFDECTEPRNGKVISRGERPECPVS